MSKKTNSTTPQLLHRVKGKRSVTSFCLCVKRCICRRLEKRAVLVNTGPRRCICSWESRRLFFFLHGTHGHLKALFRFTKYNKSPLRQNKTPLWKNSSALQIPWWFFSFCYLTNNTVEEFTTYLFTQDLKVRHKTRPEGGRHFSANDKETNRAGSKKRPLLLLHTKYNPPKT